MYAFSTLAPVIAFHAVDTFSALAPVIVKMVFTLSSSLRCMVIERDMTALHWRCLEVATTHDGQTKAILTK